MTSQLADTIALALIVLAGLGLGILVILSGIATSLRDLGFTALYFKGYWMARDILGRQAQRDAGDRR